MDFGLGLGANHSDTLWYREDLQQRHRSKGAIEVPDSVQHGTRLEAPHGLVPALEQALNGGCLWPASGSGA